MSKTKITRLFVGSVLAVAGGVTVGLGALLVAIARGVVRLGGPDVIKLDDGALAGLLVWLAIASLVVAVGAVGAVASWVGALLNTFRLDDRTWFALLLVLGLCSFGWLAMAAYVLAGPDGTAQGTGRAVATARQP